MPDLEQFKLYLRYEKGLTESTGKMYTRAVRDFFDFVGKEPDAVTDMDVRRWITTRGGAASSITCRLAALRAFYKSIGPTDPTQSISRPKRRFGMPRPIEDVEEKIAKLPPGYREIARLLLETGLRISEACSIRVALPVPDQLLIRGKGEKDRLVQLQPAAQEALTVLEGVVVIPGRSKRQIQRKFQQAGFKAHGLRHTFGCELAAANADIGEIQDLMGHSSPATTRIYAAYSTDRLRGALQRRTDMQEHQRGDD